MAAKESGKDSQGGGRKTAMLQAGGVRTPRRETPSCARGTKDRSVTMVLGEKPW